MDRSSDEEYIPNGYLPHDENTYPSRRRRDRDDDDDRPFRRFINNIQFIIMTIFVLGFMGVMYLMMIVACPVIYVLMFLQRIAEAVRGVYNRAINRITRMFVDENRHSRRYHILLEDYLRNFGPPGRPYNVIERCTGPLCPICEHERTIPEWIMEHRRFEVEMERDRLLDLAAREPLRQEELRHRNINEERRRNIAQKRLHLLEENEDQSFGDQKLPDGPQRRDTSTSPMPQPSSSTAGLDLEATGVRRDDSAQTSTQQPDDVQQQSDYIPISRTEFCFSKEEELGLSACTESEEESVSESEGEDFEQEESKLLETEGTGVIPRDSDSS